MTTNGCGVSFWGDENILKLIIMKVAQLCKYTKTHLTVYFKWVNFMVYELYLNKAV